ncbi:MAG: hypothetical protein ACM3TU_02875 [Bacillota bacterium]
MTDPTITFLKRLRGVTLSDNERLAMRERLAAYADMHPVLAPAATPAAGFFGIFSSRSMSVYATALALFLIVGSGVTFAAEGSVPGDSLYALKIHVNEPVMSALAPTAAGQARLAATLATRRVNEAVTLASRGTLTPARQTYLKEEFAEGVTLASKKADVLASRGNVEAADTVRANFAASLAGQAQALGAVTTKDPAATADLLSTVVSTSEDIAEDADPGSVLAVVETEETEPEATATLVIAEAPAEEAHPALMSAKLAPAATLAPTTTPVATTSATTTPKERKFIPFSRQLHVSAEAFAHRFASTTFGQMPILLPKLDSAVPQDDDR